MKFVTVSMILNSLILNDIEFINLIFLKKLSVNDI